MDVTKAAWISRSRKYINLLSMNASFGEGNAEWANQSIRYSEVFSFLIKFFSLNTLYEVNYLD